MLSQVLPRLLARMDSWDSWSNFESEEKSLRKKRKTHPYFYVSTFGQAFMRVFQHESDKNEFFLYSPFMKSSEF
jgi:hypothetical protein